MNIFPFELPAATLVYVSLYLLTLSVHVVFMSYVLAGSAYMAVAAVLGRVEKWPAAGILRDWLPFGLGAAITAGVAPLLFVQILYKENFYTANLLLFHRWMAVVPVLIIGFYLLYLGKSKAMERWGRGAGAAVAVLAFACFAFTAYSWTEMHLLALDPAVWTGFYAERRMVYSDPSLVPRAAMWLAGSVPVMVAIVGWQLWQKGRDSGAHVKQLAAIAMAGAIAAPGFAAWYYRTLDPMARALLDAPGTRVYVAMIGAGLMTQILVWAHAWATARLARRALIAASAGAALGIFATACTREIMRMDMLATDEHLAMHARVARAGGMAVFVAFLIINIGVIAWCFTLVRRSLKQGQGDQSRGENR